MNVKSKVLITALFILTLTASLVFSRQIGNNTTIRLGVIGMGGGAFEAMKAYEEELNVRLTHLTTDRFKETPLPDLSEFDVLFASFASSDPRDNYRQAIVDGLQKNPDIKIFCVGPAAICQGWDEWVGNRIVKFDPQMAQYYGLSTESMRDLLRYTLITYFGRSGEVAPPRTDNLVKIFHPEYGELKSINDFLRMAKKNGWDTADAPRVALGTWRHHCVFHQPKVIAALINELKERGILAVCLIADDPGFTNRMRQFKPDLVIMTSHTREPVDFWEELGVPRIHALWFTDESLADWRRSVNTGMSKSSIQHQIVSAELRGATECLTSGGTESGGNSGDEVLPIPDRTRRIADRANAWINLSRMENNEKKIAIIIYDREADRSGLMSGPAHCLNAPRSMIKFLHAMSNAGYDVRNIPTDADELLERIVDHGRQMGSWEPGPLDTLAGSGHAVLVPEEQYRIWFEEKVPQWRREEVVKHWGAVPGNLMVWEYSGKRFLVLPKIDLGNVILMTQPPKGETITASLESEAFEENLLPPTHHYLATYFWLQEEFNADALIHFGSHGSEWLFPGKQAVLSRSDWSDMMIGNMPNINPWLASNTAELNPCKRRARAVTINFLPPPLMEAGLSDELLNLESTINQYLTLSEGALKKKFAESITEQVRQCNLDREVKIQSLLGITLNETDIRRVAMYLHDLKNEMVPANMHILGEPPADELLIPYLVHCMGKRFIKAAKEIFTIPSGDVSEDDYLKKKGEEILRSIFQRELSPVEAVIAAGGEVEGGRLPDALRESLEMAVVMNEGFKQTSQEIDNILAALNGRFVTPGPAGSPERNPGVVPTGRNMYLLNPEELPSHSSWELGTKLIKDYLANELATKGQYPQKVAFSLIPFATYSDYGIIESQIMYLMGVRPVWDAKNRVRDVELIPASELGRPRIDVFLSARSIYRDELPSMMKLLDKAIRLAASTNESNNFVFRNSIQTRKKLEKQGFAKQKALALSQARMFGAEPDEVIDSHNWFFYLTERTGEWENREDLLEVYLSYCKHVYTEGVWGEQAPEAFDSAIQGTELILRSWYDNRDFVLSNKFAWWVDGTLSLAIKHITGNEPALMFVDVRNTDEASIVESSQAVQRDFRMRLMNPKWIKQMMQEGYAGGEAISNNVDNLLGWDIMRDQSISDSNWEDVTDVYIRDSENLRIREWFDAENPYAFQQLTVTMLETIRKDFWQADEETALEIAAAYAQSVAEHGKAGGIREGGNEKLERFVEETLSAPGTAEMDALLEQFKQKAAELEVPADRQPLNEPVDGKKMTESEETPSTTTAIKSLPVLIVIGIVALVIVIIGFRRKPTTMRTNHQNKGD